MHEQWLVSRPEGATPGGAPNPPGGRPRERPLPARQWGGPVGQVAPEQAPGRGRERNLERARQRQQDLRLAVLMLLAEKPHTGHGLIREIEERSDGRWSPPAFAVYPLIEQLLDEGLIQTAAEGRARELELTEAGSSLLARRGDVEAPWRRGSGQAERYSAELRALLSQLDVAARQVGLAGTRAQMARAQSVLADARRGLYRILAEEAEAASDEG